MRALLTPRHLLLAALPLVAAPSLFAQTLQNLSFGEPTTFEAVTWNIERFPKNGQVTLDKVKQVMEALDVDLWALQEIDDRSALQQMVDSMPGYQAFYQSSFYAGLTYVYNTSTVQIVNIYEIYTTQPFWSPFPRSPVVMELKFKGEDIVVINNHFKCCGDGILDLSDPGDEETRRYTASNLLKQFIDSTFPNGQVIMLGDLNDILIDVPVNNVFQSFFDDPANYQFADWDIAAGSSLDWSYPTWPSHLDHLLMTNELLAEFAEPCSDVRTIRIDDFLPGGWAEYDADISDHRPVGLKLAFGGAGCATGTLASETVRLGSPPNPNAFLPGMTSRPIIGATWDPWIDHTSFHTTAFLDFVVVSLQGAINLPTTMGTLLVNPPFEQPVELNLFPGTPFALAVPNSLTIVGLNAWTMGGSLGPTFKFTNALDLVIGDV